MPPVSGLRSWAMSVADSERPSSRLAELRDSARGWHGIQLAVIGFIGFCGVLQNGRPDNPTWLQVWASILVLVALVLACIATFLVGRVAWPLFGGPPSAVAGGDFEAEARRLRRGLLLTFVAVAVLALGTASGWWPQPAGEKGGGQLVAVQASSGERVCGSLAQASPGRLRVSVDGRPVDVSLQNVAAVDPVDSC